LLNYLCKPTQKNARSGFFKPYFQNFLEKNFTFFTFLTLYYLFY